MGRIVVAPDCCCLLIGGLCISPVLRCRLRKMWNVAFYFNKNPLWYHLFLLTLHRVCRIKTLISLYIKIDKSVWT